MLIFTIGVALDIQKTEHCAHHCLSTEDLEVLKETHH